MAVIDAGVLQEHGWQLELPGVMLLLLWLWLWLVLLLCLALFEGILNPHLYTLLCLFDNLVVLCLLLTPNANERIVRESCKHTHTHGSYLTLLLCNLTHFVGSFLLAAFGIVAAEQHQAECVVGKVLLQVVVHVAM